MAIGRLSVKVGKAGKAAPHAAYLAREGRYAQRLERGEKLEATEAGNMPAWARHDAQQFWQAADAHERKNGTTYREMEIALPRELDPAERAALVREFVHQEIGEAHAYQWAIHTPAAADGQEQPHVHLMFSERQRDGIERDPEQYFKRYNAKAPEKGGARKGYGPSAGQTLSAAERAAELKELRGRWQDMANRHLERAGLAERIDMRSHAERGTGLEPEAKQLPSQWRDQGRTNVIEFRQARRDQVQAAHQARQAVPNVSAEIIQLEAERQRRAQAKQEAARQAAARRRQADQDKAERQRIERMSAAELQAEIARLRPPPVRELVERNPGVIEAEQLRQDWQEQHRLARAREAQARSEAASWREAHPVRARLHDMGIAASSLAHWQQVEADARATWLAAAPRVVEAIEQARHTRGEVEARAAIDTAPARARADELEKLLQEKARQEREQAQREQAEREQKTELARAVVLAARLHREGKLATDSPAVRRVLEAVSGVQGGDTLRRAQVRRELDEPQKARVLLALAQQVAPQLEKHLQRERRNDRGMSR